MPPSLAPTFLQLDIAGALDVGLISVIFAFLFVDLFDNSGTLIAVANGIAFAFALIAASIGAAKAASLPLF